MGLMKLSTTTNPLTAPLPKKEGLSPAERAVDRFAISGNAIVTGGAGGLGLASVRALLEHGATGACIFDLPARFEKAQDEFRELRKDFPGAKIMEEVVDVANEESVQHGVESAVKGMGGVHVLLCAAGIAIDGDATEITLEFWRRIQDTNTTGSFLCARTIGREMIKQGQGGSIIFVASLAAHRAVFPVNHTAYCVSKAGILQLTASLAAEWAQHGIRVNSISPGYMETPMTQVEEFALGKKIWEDRTPMGRMGVAEEVTGPVVMLSSGAGRFMTGIDIMVDGGGHVF